VKSATTAMARKDFIVFVDLDVKECDLGRLEDDSVNESLLD
jgi:hypothetical protein